ncbi:MAG: radical SAM protein [Coriobacteriales bacterium]|jgi:coproporphyrinogen III oxidase-like Fe-S oxidoreductase|nr:radical SAM protein [Coriobacteriales bacterium]
MLSERLQTRVMKALSSGYLDMEPLGGVRASLPAARDRQTPCLLYVHIPFCERLCPYCSFCRYPFDELRARAYFACLRSEMQMVARLGYAVESLYIGGGTPTILIDELARTIDYAHELFKLREVSCETNPNHLIPRVLDVLDGRVQRLSVGVQSFDDGLLKRMRRFDKYGSGEEILERLLASEARFESLNADMIFNFPSQTEDILIYDLACILESRVSQCTFYPLMASPAVEKSLAATVGKVDYRREAQFYELICEVLAAPACSSGSAPTHAHTLAPIPALSSSSTSDSTPAPTSAPTHTPALSLGLPQTSSAAFSFGSAWTFNASDTAMIDEYIINYEEYPAIGAGGFSYLSGSLYANTFSVDEYIRRLESGQMSVKQRSRFSKTSRMRYRLMMQLFGLELDKAAWKRDFGVGVAAGLPAEYAFFKAASAFAVDNKARITLTPKGRYLLVALMREFFIGVNGLRDLARSTLPPEEQDLVFT